MKTVRIIATALYYLSKVLAFVFLTAVVYATATLLAHRSGAGWAPICDFGPSVLGLATGSWNDDLCRQSVRDIVFHNLEAALCLVVVEGQPKLVEPPVGEMEMLE